jgi:hypothetical protein
MAPSDMIVAQKKLLVVKASDYQLIVGNLYKMGADGILRCFMLEQKRLMILGEAHDGIVGGHYAQREFHKIFWAWDFGGLNFTNMQRSTVSHAMYANKWESHPRGIKFL